jgi:phosphate butyryltransferase
MYESVAECKAGTNLAFVFRRRGDIMKSLDEMLDQVNRTQPKTVAVAQAADAEVLRAVKRAYDLGIARFLLVGDDLDIKRISREVELDLDQQGLVVMNSSAEKSATIAVKAVHDEEAQVGKY